MNSHRCSSPEETISFGRSVGASLTAGDIVSLEGSLGAGKTTMAKGIIEALGVAETVTSPTFTIISEYSGRLPVYHMDLYRIEDEEELIHLGIDEIIYAGGISIIEWIDRLPELPSRYLRVLLEVVQPSGDRLVTVETIEGPSPS
ncbi:tRNA (adenosine(37)-N6)-threonylcarbamoyltransferase complex ATPase subunit type 1 TsaE [Marispirochaeta aestuarii]|uniref:tRNA threonylcarbamoyladenosine biosynthesis protein TsaE n=1 Tax=Marispirochaeta aestuarii TaxID=1963862 RepID=A0A1Y1RX29_9SPIO|nr:tRNA (adenosine(37)-N6)-threonylcarbamoyltransferase complex ATPase subunit type 1 TsaE [Marispirochaeta aestuarii]ORC34224.1 tRNA (adenosine(37)-N6)-threonylcarbamoyltransferase complex ATPase subunit type 1 TsaE [Marispirochaeta aestuarii]